jgi:hypothetical protein
VRITNFSKKSGLHVSVNQLIIIYLSSRLVFIPAHFSKKSIIFKKFLFLVTDVKVAILDIHVGGAASYNIERIKSTTQG